MEDRDMNSEGDQLTVRPVAPPRIKRKSKQLSKSIELDPVTPAAPSSPVAPKRPPAPRPRPRNTESIDTPKALHLVKHPKVVKTASVPLRPPPPHQKPPERPAPPQSIPPRPKSSMEHSSTHNGYSRSASNGYSSYGTVPRRKKTGNKRSLSEESTVATKVVISKAGDTRYMNVAPRLVKQSAMTTSDSSRLSTRYKHPSVTPKKEIPSPLENSYHKQPARPQSQVKRPRPPRPAPPPPHKVAQYTRIYSEIQPLENRLSQHEDNYSYVSMQPRFVAGVSRQMDGLDLHVPTGEYQSELYENHDYNGPEETYYSHAADLPNGALYQKAASVDDSLYMSLSSHTMNGNDIYMVPRQERVARSISPQHDRVQRSISPQHDRVQRSISPQHDRVQRSTSPQDNGTEGETKEESDESDGYSTPDDARLPSQSPDCEEELYMALSTSTREELSIYQALSVIQSTS